MSVNDHFSGLMSLVELGGPVLVLLLLASAVSLALFILKLIQFRRAGVGQHSGLARFIHLHDRGDTAEGERRLAEADDYLSALALLALRSGDAKEARARLEAEAEQSFLELEKGMRFLDVVAQTAPLLGLFGTVLGMIEAFQALQTAGSQVDPSVLAGGIWVALLTTAAGLAVAMPVSIGLSWLEGRLDRDRAMAERLLSAIATPLPDAADRAERTSEPVASPQAASGGPVRAELPGTDKAWASA
ncbi:MAG: MotA/TolQ/ExbB proton channel family protein [Erythrobacter sp.]